MRFGSGDLVGQSRCDRVPKCSSNQSCIHCSPVTTAFMISENDNVHSINIMKISKEKVKPTHWECLNKQLCSCLWSLHHSIGLQSATVHYPCFLANFRCATLCVSNGHMWGIWLQMFIACRSFKVLTQKQFGMDLRSLTAATSLWFETHLHWQKVTFICSHSLLQSFSDNSFDAVFHQLYIISCRHTR